MKTIENNKIKKSLFLIKGIVIVLIMAAFNQSCTNLDEELFSEVTPDDFFSSEEEYVSALGAAYTQFGDFASNDPQAVQETSTDEMVVPTRGQDWDDGGHWRRLHLHSWTYEQAHVNGAWNFGFAGVNTANRLIFQFQSLVDQGQVEQATADAFIAELQAVRGFFYWQLIDVFGNVPLVLDFATAEASPSTVPRADVYAAIVSDLESAVPKLSDAVDGTTYGRMNYYAGQTLLAKLYLNAGVYTGTDQWDKAIAACNEVINDGAYSLENNYFSNFNQDNSGSKEFIFAIPYDQVFFEGFNIAVRTLHYGSQATYNLTQQPWNGFCTLEEFYNSYEDTDLRKGDVGTLEGPAGRRGNFIAGYQYTSGGVLVLDDGFEVPNLDRQPEPLLGDPDEDPLNFGNMFSDQPQINELGPQAYRQAGIRIGKWEIPIGSDPGTMSNDYAVFRYADVLLMKAEALFRKGLDADALILVNQIRSRAGVDDLTTLNGPLSFDMEGGDVPGGELFNEIGREMFAENHRRQDLIRWGYWTDLEKWVLPFYNPQDKLETGEHTSIYPVHRDKLDANPNLTQNPGY
ncbi:MAG: RagB/SusD family nutrient uptake outer membrane protein [Bacteroidales bacterium]|nr:RagB/SusD family nutrient uptake outer membrane protein [Bacteroidales bacterium]